MKVNWTTLFLELREEDLCKFSGNLNSAGEGSIFL